MSAAANITGKLPLGIGEDSTGAPLGHDPKNPGRDNRVTRMGTASIPRLITEFSIPSILGMMVNGAYVIIDSVFLGTAMGPVGIEAMTVVNPIVIVFLAISMLIGVGGNALAALRFGEGKRVDAEISLGNTVLLSVIASALVAVLAAIPIVLDSLLTLASTPDVVRPHAEAFLRIVSFGFIFQCIGMGVNNFIRTAGAPNRALLTMVIGAVSCTAFNYLFVIQLGWGVEGSAFATICGQAISCASVLWFFIFTKNVPLRLHVRYMRLRPKVVKTILSLGTASFFLQAGAAVVSFVLNHLLAVYGAASPLGEEFALASIGVVQRIAIFSVLPIIGVSVAIQPLIGFNYGARIVPRVRRTFWYGVAGVTAIGLLMWALVHLFPEQIVGAFGITSRDLSDFTVFALKVQLLMLPFLGFQIVGSNYFQATGQPVKSMVLTLTRQILFLVPLLLVLPQILPHILPQFTSLDALYFAAPCSDVLAIVTTAVFVFFEMRRLKKLEAGKARAKILEEGTPGAEAASA